VPQGVLSFVNKDFGHNSDYHTHMRLRSVWLGLCLILPHVLISSVVDQIHPLTDQLPYFAPFQFS
jgi:hypothetical protein